MCVYIYIHTYNVMLLSHKKEWILAICNNMDQSWGYYTKWNKSDREDKCYMISPSESRKQNKQTK